MKVWVVSFAPNINDEAGVGGFDWYYKVEAAEARLLHLLEGGAAEHDLRLTLVEVPENCKDVTAYVDLLCLL